MTVNGFSHHGVSRPLQPGVYAPIPTFFFKDTEDLDLDTFAKHVVRIARAGVGPVICGTMGEAHHLSSNERALLIQTARHALDVASLTHVPIIAGTGMPSTRATIELTKEAAGAGADYAIVISSGYFAGAIASNKQAQKKFWTDVADASPIPVMIYNYPGATGGIDLESDVIEEIAQHPNICGVKLTCGNVGKLTRIASTVSWPAFDKSYPRKNKDAPFIVLGGFCDFLVPSVFARAHGAITGLANLAPHAILRTFDLAAQAAEGKPKSLAEAQKLQGIIARADRTIALTGIAGTKFLLEKAHKYGGLPRRPLVGLTSEQEKAIWNHPDTQELLALEAQCAAAYKAAQ